MVDKVWDYIYTVGLLPWINPDDPFWVILPIPAVFIVIVEHIVIDLIRIVAFRHNYSLEQIHVAWLE